MIRRAVAARLVQDGSSSRTSTAARFGWPVVYVVAAVVVALLVVAPFVARDYWDHGPYGLLSSMLVGWAGLAVCLRLIHRKQPVIKALMAVAPWALGFGGMAYLGLLLLPLEVVATAAILRRLDRGSDLSRGRSLLLAGFARFVSLGPLLL